MLRRGSNSKCGNKWVVLEYVLEVKSTKLANGDMGSEKMGRIKNKS